MKILNVVYSLGKGGTERAAQNFATGYAENGNESRLLFTRQDGPRRAELVARGIPVHDLRRKEDVELLKEWAPDVVHVHSHGLQEDEMSNLVRTFCSAKFVETNVFSRPSPWEGSLHATFQLSNWCYHLYGLRGGNLKKSMIVPYPVETSRFSRASKESAQVFRAQHQLSEDDFVIGRIGQSFPGKWSDVLIDVFEDLRQKDENVRLLIVNPPDSIRMRIRNSKFETDTRIIDTIIGDDALSVCYSAMDVFLHIAEQGESFGMVLAEALLCETPVVTLATPWGDNSQGEVVGHRVGGFVAARRDCLSALVFRLRRDASLRRQLGVAGRQRVIDSFSTARVAKLVIGCVIEIPESDKRVVRPKELLASSEGRVIGLELLLAQHRVLLPFFLYSTGYRPLSRLPGFLAGMPLTRVVRFFQKFRG